MLKILGRKTSSNVQKVLWCCEEIGLPFERTDIGGEFGKNKEPAYLAFNPNGLVPTINDDGFILWESNSCVRYLAGKYGKGKLWPADAQLAKTPFVAGSELTVGDIAMGNAIHRWFKFPIERPDLANLKAWYDRLCARPAYQKHIGSL